MKAKGFTLIELLAVIVILAIIALIATPIVLGIIDDTKESAQLRSAEMYLKGVANAVMKENLEQEGNFRPTECNITMEGNLYCEPEDVFLEIEVDGEKPKDGSIMFENGKIKEVILEYQNATIVKNEEGNLVYSDEESGSGSEEEETLAPGLYDAEGNMTMSWQELIDGEYLFVNNGELVADTDDTGNYAGTAYNALIGKLVIDDSVTSIGMYGFEYCSKLTSILIPDSVESIDSYAFTGCSGLTSMTIPNSITSISSYTFENCSGLSSITIPDSVTNISQEAFWFCENLITINYTGADEQWNTITFGNNWNGGCPEITVHCTDGDIVIPAS